MFLSCTVSEIARHQSKIANCNLPHLYLATLLGVIPLQFGRDLWRQKTRVHGLLYVVICVIIHLALLVQCRLVTDGWIDRRTQDASIYCASIAFRGND